MFPVQSSHRRTATTCPHLWPSPKHDITAPWQLLFGRLLQYLLIRGWIIVISQVEFLNRKIGLSGWVSCGAIFYFLRDSQPVGSKCLRKKRRQRIVLLRHFGRCLTKNQNLLSFTSALKRFLKYSCFSLIWTDVAINSLFVEYAENKHHTGWWNHGCGAKQSCFMQWNVSVTYVERAQKQQSE